MILRIKWEVDDGFVCGDRSRILELDTNDYADSDEEWNTLSEEERNNYINDAVQDHFNDKVSWYIKKIDVKE